LPDYFEGAYGRAESTALNRLAKRRQKMLGQGVEQLARGGGGADQLLALQREMGEAGIAEEADVVAGMGLQRAGAQFGAGEAEKARQAQAAEAQTMREFEERMTRAGWSREDIENAKREKLARQQMWLSFGSNVLGSVLDAVVPG